MASKRWSTLAHHSFPSSLFHSQKEPKLLTCPTCIYTRERRRKSASRNELLHRVPKRVAEPKRGKEGREATYLVPNDEHQPSKPERESSTVDQRVVSPPPRKRTTVAGHRRKREGGKGREVVEVGGWIEREGATFDEFSAFLWFANRMRTTGKTEQTACRFAGSKRDLSPKDSFRDSIFVEPG